MLTESLAEKIKSSGVIAVLVIDDADNAVPAAEALLCGGVDCIELTLRTPSAMEALRRIQAEVPEMIAGVGTILTLEQVGEVAAAGASFGVAPGMNSRVVMEAKRAGLPFAPGICTPSDIEAALECGCRVLKFFPAEPLGGMGYLKSISTPYAHLGLSFIPLGGVDAGNAESYLREPNILALGGSWIAPRDLIRKQDWSSITQRAHEVAKIVERTRGIKKI